jgi:hypothetical protein
MAEINPRPMNLVNGKTSKPKQQRGATMKMNPAKSEKRKIEDSGTGM